MKKIILAFLITSTSVFAGDLGLVCFKDGDVGNYVQDQTAIEKNNVAVSFTEGRKSYVILLQRKSLVFYLQDFQKLYTENYILHR